MKSCGDGDDYVWGIVGRRWRKEESGEREKVTQAGAGNPPLASAGKMQPFSRDNGAHGGNGGEWQF